MFLHLLWCVCFLRACCVSVLHVAHYLLYELAVCVFLHLVCFCMFCVWYVHHFCVVFTTCFMNLMCLCLHLLCFFCVCVLCVSFLYTFNTAFMNLLCVCSAFAVCDLRVFCVWFVIFAYSQTLFFCELDVCFCFFSASVVCVFFCVICVWLAYHVFVFSITFLMNVLWIVLHLLRVLRV